MYGTGFVDRERVHVNEFEHSHHTTGQASAYTVKSEELTPTMTSYMLPSMVYNPFASYASPYTPYGGISFAYGSLPKAAFPDPDQADARTESYIWSDESLPADPADLPLTPSSPPARHLGPSLDSLGDPSKLKGVFWPGMDLFDAATNEMKRQRNQKKAASATERLELMSQQVEATECKFNADVTLIREREITGFPNSDSINGDDVPTPARKKRKPAVRKTAASTKVTATSERLPRSKARRRIKADDVGSRGPQIFVPYGAKTDAVIDTSRRGKDAVKKKRKSRAAKRKTSHLDQASIASLTESLETIDPRHVNTATDMFYDGPVESIENNDGFAAEPCSPKPWRNEWGYAQYGDHVSAYSYDHVGSALMNWYAQEQDQGGVVPNPLYMPNDTFYVSDDDQRTISAPASEA